MSSPDVILPTVNVAFLIYRKKTFRLDRLIRPMCPLKATSLLGAVP